MPGVGAVTSKSAALSDIVQRLVDALTPDQIVLFGSHARGTSREDSDIDLLVIMPTHEKPIARMARAHRALRGVPTAVDVFVMTPDEVAAVNSWQTHVATIALREGRIVYERG